MESTVSYILFTEGEKETVKILIEDYIKISTARTVMFTIGENKIEYYNDNNEKLSLGKGIVSVAKQRRLYLKSIGESY